MELKKIDTWLGIAQKIVLLVGLLVSAWIFLIRKEISPHVKITASSEVFENCSLRVNVQVENKGGRVWKIENSIARVFSPDFNQNIDWSNRKNLEIATQILPVKHEVRIGEVSSYGFNFKLSPDIQSEYVIVRVALTHKEKPKWINMVEEAVSLKDCKSQ